MVEISGPCPELNWHHATRADAQREDLVRSLSTGRFREPVILRGAADEWPAVCDASRAWTLSRLVADHGSFVGDVRERSPYGSAATGTRLAFGYVASMNSDMAVLAITQARAPLATASSKSLYAMLTPALTMSDVASEAVYAETESSTKKEYERMSILPQPVCGAKPSPPAICAALGRGDQYSRMVWMGPKGTVTPLHRDPYHNCLCQVEGAKRVLLFDARDEERMYPIGDDPLQANSSRVDAERPDLARFPKFADAHARMVEVHPGDLLYIPRRWWHHVRALSRSASVSFWWL